MPDFTNAFKHWLDKSKKQVLTHWISDLRKFSLLHTCKRVSTEVAEVRFLPPFVSVSVCFPHDISKTDAAGIIKLDIEMFHNESWKPIYFAVKRSKVKVKSHKKTLSACVFALLWALVSSS